MKISKRFLFLIAVFTALVYSGCTPGDDYFERHYKSLKIVPVNPENSYTEENGVITFLPVEADDGKSDDEYKYEYRIYYGYRGQLVTTMPGTKLTFIEADICGKNGNCAIVCNEDTEIAFEGNKSSYIQSENALGAIYGKKKIKLSGAGRVSIEGGGKCALNANNVEVSGSGTFHFYNTKDGTPVQCSTFTVPDGQTFTMYLTDSKYGLFAKESISIESGNFKIFWNETGLKTNRSYEDAVTGSSSEGDTGHFIKLSGGTFNFFENDNKYDSDTFDDSGAIYIED